MGKTLLYILIFLGMIANGLLYLAWFLTPPNPDRIGYWFFIYLFVFPFLGILGIAALLLKRRLNIPWGIGTALLLYVGILTLIANSFPLGLSWIFTLLPPSSYEFFHVALFVATLLRLVTLVRQEWVDRPSQDVR